jgi:hypothetical protein
MSEKPAYSILSKGDRKSYTFGDGTGRAKLTQLSEPIVESDDDIKQWWRVWDSREPIGLAGEVFEGGPWKIYKYNSQWEQGEKVGIFEELSNGLRPLITGEECKGLSELDLAIIKERRSVPDLKARTIEDWRPVFKKFSEDELIYLADKVTILHNDDILNFVSPDNHDRRETSVLFRFYLGRELLSRDCMGAMDVNSTGIWSTVRRRHRYRRSKRIRDGFSDGDNATLFGEAGYRAVADKEELRQAAQYFWGDKRDDEWFDRRDADRIWRCGHQSLEGFTEWLRDCSRVELIGSLQFVQKYLERACKLRDALPAETLEILEGRLEDIDALRPYVADSAPVEEVEYDKEADEYTIHLAISTGSIRENLNWSKCISTEDKDVDFTEDALDALASLDEQTPPDDRVFFDINAIQLKTDGLMVEFRADDYKIRSSDWGMGRETYTVRRPSMSVTEVSKVYRDKNEWKEKSTQNPVVFQT